MTDISKRLSKLSPEQLELLRKKLEKGKKTAVPGKPITRRQDLTRSTMTAAQLRLWFMYQLDPRSPFYNIPVAVRLRGKVDHGLLEKTFQRITERHEILRAIYRVNDKGEPEQHILPGITLQLPFEDLSGSQEAERSAASILQRFAAQPFKLEEAPLIRTMLIKMASHDYILALNQHHIISDGWSVGIILREMIHLYTAFSEQRDPELPPADIQYADYAEWQGNRLTKELLDKQLGFWKTYLEGMPHRLDLPLDYTRPSVISHTGKHFTFKLGSQIHSLIRSFSKDHAVSPFMIVMAAVQSFLFRMTRQDDFGIGAPLANREHDGVQNMPGLFVNTMVLRAKFPDTATFMECVNRVKSDIINASSNQDVPFEHIVDALQPERDLSHSPLFQVMFDYQQSPFDALKAGSVSMEIQDINIEVAKFDLLFLMLERQEDIVCTLEYNSDLFKPETIEHISKYFRVFLTNLLHSPDTAITDIKLIDETEEQKILYTWNQTHKPYRDSASVITLFEEQVDKSPQVPAMVFGDTTITYFELNESANRLARFLTDQGVKTGDLVGLYMERDTSLFISILAILKCGAVYVPLDTAYPAQRIAFMLEDSGVNVLITSEALRTGIPETVVSVIAIETIQETLSQYDTGNLSCDMNGGAPAYVIYTSGSTGRPKGVVVPHKAISRLILKTDYISIMAGDRIAQISNAAFDAATFEIWGSLLTGATLVGIDKEVVLSSRLFIKALQDQQIHHMFITTALFNQIARDVSDGFRSLTTVLFGGEASDPEAVKKVIDTGPPAHLVHVYGPTENTTFSTWYTVKRINESQYTVPIGRPIANSTCYVLDTHLQPCPPGVPGELYVGGDGLAQQYLNRPELTSERFIRHPFGNETDRLYKTGDLVRYLSDGNIEFLGRIDQQVKIRGFRVELGEIESLLKSHDAVRDAVVLLHNRSETDKQLLAYYVSEPEKTTEGRHLRAFLSEKLPDYMVPVSYTKLQAIPLTPNGKVDKRALPIPEEERPDLEVRYIPPRNALESYLAGVWQDILGIRKIGIYDHFFELGGNSLKAAVFINRIQKDLNETAHVAALFKAPRIAELATYMLEYYPDLVSEEFGITKEKDRKLTIDTNLLNEQRITPEKVADFREIITPLPPFPRDKETPKNPRAIFVLSPPRSGSTLLRVMLAGNTQLFSPPELDLLSFNTLRERTQAFSREGLEIWLEATIRAVMEIKGYDAEQARDIIRNYEQNNMSTKAFYAEMQNWLGNRILVDKTPTYPFDPAILKRAEQNFEHTNYIHLVRHPYAMIYSFIEAKLDQNFFRYKHPFNLRELGELIWIVSHRNILDFLQTIPDERQYRLRFEDLLTDPEVHLKRLCSFLGIDFQQDMLKPYEGRKMTDGVSAHSQMVGDFKFYLHKDINRSVADRWKTYHKVDFLSDMAWELAASLEYPVEKELAASLREEERSSLDTIPGVPRDSELPLSHAQKRIWFLDQLEPGNPQYNIPVAVRLQGRPDISLLEQSLNHLIERHEILRTIFREINGVPSQIIRPRMKLLLEHVDLRSLPATEREAATQKTATDFAGLPFKLFTGPLIRAKIVQTDETDFVLIIVMHHIISDGWSMNIFIRELSTVYADLLAKRSISLDPLSIQFCDFAAWQSAWLTETRLKKQIDYWRKQLTDIPPVLNLPTDFQRPSVQTHRGEQLVFKYPAVITDQLNALSRNNETTLFVTLTAAYFVLLFRYSQQEDITIGTPIANRMRRELEPLIGFFVNTLVLRVKLHEAMPFTELLDQVKTTAMHAYSNQDVPFEKLVDILQPERNLNHTALFQVMFAMQSSDLESVSLPGVEISPFQIAHKAAKFDLSLSVVERQGELRGQLEYDCDLYSASTAQRMTEHYFNILESLIEDPGCPIGKLTLLSEKERNQVTIGWNSTAQPYGANICLHQRFEMEVRKQAKTQAILYLNEGITFGDLNVKANQLAHYLIKSGITPEQVVGICFDRSVEMIVAVLGTLKAGAAYLPLDPSYPEDRIRFITEDAGVTVILTQRAYADLFATGSVSVVTMDKENNPFSNESHHNPDVAVEPDNLAYVIYTSGTTGRPKGVMMPHRPPFNLARNLNHTIYQPIKGKSQRVSLNAPLPFDASVQQLVMLIHGHQLVIIPNDIRNDGAALTAYIHDQQIDVFDCVPSQLKLLFDAGLTEKKTHMPKAVLPGGEAIDPVTWKKMIHTKRISFYNMYGPTECTVDASMFPVILSPDRPVIGRSAGNVRFYVLDEHLEPVPIGVPGELHISGEQMARGYLNRPALTAEKFIPDPFSPEPGSRMYKTGDRVRYNNKGHLEFLGRLDDQVKLRGFRIELGEIEEVLKEHKAIHNTVAVIREDTPGNRRIVAYLVPAADETPGTAELRAYAGLKLPDYMIPAVFMWLDEIPLTPNGKIDRKQLPVPDQDRPDLDNAFIEASTEKETILAGIWQEVIGIDKVGIRDNFFELGGDSILSIQVIARAKQAGIAFTPKQLFEHPTIEGILSVAGELPAIKAEQGIITGPIPLTPIQQHFFTQEYTNPHHWNQSLMLEVSETIDTDTFANALQAVILHHDQLRVRFYNEGDHWHQRLSEPDGKAAFTIHDFSELSAGEQKQMIEKESTNYQSMLNLSEGPVFRVAYFNCGPGKADRLLIIVHHLAMDGVSWRILTHDIQMAYSLLSAGQPVQLPMKTTSFKYWAEKLASYAATETVVREKDFWLTSLKQQNEPRLHIPVDFENGTNLESSARMLSLSLDREATDHLLHRLPSVFKARISELLLAGLVRAYVQWSGTPSCFIQLEGHGREHLFDDVDLSRTIGWFTSMYPLLIDSLENNSLEGIIQTVKERSQAIPYQGIHFGMLRYLHPDETVRNAISSLPVPQMVFNYLGRFDRPEDGGSSFRPSSESFAAERSPGTKREFLLDISASVMDNTLTLAIVYSSHVHKDQTIEHFLSLFRDSLSEMVRKAAPNGLAPEFDQVFAPEETGLKEDEMDNLLSELTEDQD